MHKRTILYRGNLKSCNYSCSYCPFSKHRALSAEMERDRQNFARFCESIVRRARNFSIGAVFITPYGEASIHPWYWEGISRLAELPEIERVGMQTNLSFSVEECLKLYDSFGGEFPEAAFDGKGCSTTGLFEGNLIRKNYSEGDFSEKKRQKLCIWATFHSEMTTVEEFVSKCHRLVQNNIAVCAGAVGVPQNIQMLRKLREKLSPEIYMWINKMDGLKRNYSPEELKAFSRIDPFFEYELRNPDAAVQMCADRCFVEADGKIHTCNISRTKEANWYDGSEEEIFEPVCSRKRCSCYLAYGGRADFILKKIFGEYPVYRIPRRFRAAFFDLDGTLLPACGEPDAAENEQNIAYKEPDASGTLNIAGGMPAGNRRGKGFSDRVRERLTALRKICPIFLATSMPEIAVKKRLKGDMDLFQGFIFASGGYLRLKDEKGDREKLYSIDVRGLSEVIRFGENVKASCAVSVKNRTAYKVTLIKRHHSVWKDEECDRAAELLKGSACRFFTEKNCLEIVSEGCDKGTGIAEICGWLGIPTRDVLSVGNDKEDDAMERVCGGFVTGKLFG